MQEGLRLLSLAFREVFRADSDGETSQCCLWVFANAGASEITFGHFEVSASITGGCSPLIPSKHQADLALLTIQDSDISR
ncbi:MAG: hypothetical protein ABT11_09910 [Novosphingobium sp. SCN 66-18]|nr:MAG: hypothetical protein ABT11_09910 [Novosphingobium sp. SCN 66-18]